MTVNSVFDPSYSIGWIQSTVPTRGTLALNAAATWLSQAFMIPATKTLSKVSIYCTAVTGTLTQLECAVHSDTTSGTEGIPSTQLSNTTTVTTLPTGAAWVEFTGLSQSITGGVRYHLVFKNNTATPASNNLTLACGNASDNMGPPFALNFATSGNGGMQQRGSTTNSGSTWTMEVGGWAHLWLEFGDGTYCGWPIQSFAWGGTGSAVYSAREVGVVYTTPNNNITTNIIGCVIPCARTGTPTGALRARLYTGSTPSLLATSSNTIEASMISTSGQNCYFTFGSVQAISPNTILRCVVGETTQSDTSSNRVNVYEYTWHNNTSAKTLKPLQLSQTYYNGTSWADTETIVTPMQLVLDPTNPFTASGGGGGGTRAYAA